MSPTQEGHVRPLTTLFWLSRFDGPALGHWKLGLTICREFSTALTYVIAVLIEDLQWDSENP